MNHIVAFLPGYSTDRQRRFDITSVPGESITDLVYAFARFELQNGNWSVTFPEPSDADRRSTTSNIAKLVQLKKRFPDLNVMISIGGWGESHNGDPTYKTTPPFTALAGTPQTRHAFVRSCMDLFIKPEYPDIGHLFTGIDIDWEFPKGVDRHHATLLFEEFHTNLELEGRSQGRHLTLSACAGTNSAELELPPVAKSLDWINLMTYIAHAPDKTDSHDQVTDFNSPLFAASTEPSANVTWNIADVVQSYVLTGFPADKLVLGINAYARTYKGVDTGRHGTYQSYVGPGPGSFGNCGALQYKELISTYLPTYESHWDGVTQSAYLYSPEKRVWMSFDSVHSVRAKAAYAEQQNLGGLMLWELSADVSAGMTQNGGSPQSLIRAMKDAM
jgi:chitinase